MSVTQDYQLQFGDTGQLLNSDAIDAINPFFDLSKITGLDTPDYRYDVRQTTGGDGGSVNVEFVDTRTIVVEGTAYGPATNLHQYLEQLKTDYRPSNVNKPFYFFTPGFGQRVIFAKSLGIKYDWDMAMRTGQTPIQIQLIAEDPVIYGDIMSMSTGLASGGAGYAFSKSFPYGYTATTGSNSINAANSGNAPVGAIVSFYNVLNPTVVNDNVGAGLQLNVAVADGEWYELGLKQRSVRLNGLTNRRNFLDNASRWFMLQPGDNQLRFLGTPNGSGTPTMTVVYRSGSY